MVPVCIDFKISGVPNAALWIFMGAIAPMAPTLTHPLSCESFLKKLHNQLHSNKGVERKRGKEKKRIAHRTQRCGVCWIFARTWSKFEVWDHCRTWCEPCAAFLQVPVYTPGDIGNIRQCIEWPIKINFSVFHSLRYRIWSKFEVWDCCRTWCIRMGSIKAPVLITTPYPSKPC